jgi:hypothetical protein
MKFREAEQGRNGEVKASKTENDHESQHPW